MNSEKVIHLGEKIERNKLKKLTKLQKIQIAVCIICILLGVLLHFTYQWSDQNAIIASFSAVNESVWEHLKITFMPMFTLAIIEYFFVKDQTNNYIEAKTIGIFVAISFITVFFFTYTGILGVSFSIIDILTYIIAVILGEIVAYKLMTRENESNTSSKILAGVILLFLLFCFIFCTYNTPQVNLFKDPIYGTYGI